MELGWQSAACTVFVNGVYMGVNGCGVCVLVNYISLPITSRCPPLGLWQPSEFLDALPLSL